VASCPGDTTVSGLGSDTVANATATDAAGNAAVGTVSGLVRAAVITVPSKPTAASLAVSGLPRKFFHGKSVIRRGHVYSLTVTTPGLASNASDAPYWLRPVKATSTHRGTPTHVSGLCRVAAGDAYTCTFVAAKAMRHSFRTFGLRAPDGTVTYRTVYVD
jgi:hypothetical protein